jgi:ribonuclease P protein component
MGTDAPRCTLPAERRLQQSGDFARIKAEGQRVVIGCLIANWSECPDGKSSRLGVVTGKSVGSSVVRSRARRLLREAFRLNQHSLRLAVDLVLVARRSISTKTRQQVETDLVRALSQAKLLQ